MGFQRHHKDTLLPIIRAQISPGTCVMSDMWKTCDCLKEEGYTHLTVNYSLYIAKLRRPRHRCKHTAHRKYTVGSQTKYASYRDIQRSLRKLPTGMVVASALWRRSFWKHNQAYRRLMWSTQRPFLVPLYALFVIWSSLHGGKKQNTQLQHMGMNWRKEIRGKNDLRLDEGIHTDFIFIRFNLKEIQL